MKIVYSNLRTETLRLIKEHLILPGISFRPLSETEASSSLGEVEDAAVFLIGEKADNPIQLTQQVYAQDQSLSIVLINDRLNHQKIKQSLLFTPFIGPTVYCVSNAAGKGLAEVVKDHIQRTQQRKNHKKFQQKIAPGLSPASRKVKRIKTDYLHRILDEAPVGLVLINKKGIILSFNKYAASLFDKTEREVLGTPLGTLFPENEQQVLADYFNQEHPAGQSKTFEIQGKDRHRFLELKLSEIDRDQPSYKIALFNDITDQVLAQRAIEESSQKVRMIVGSMPEMAWTAQPNGKIDFLNQRWYAYTGQKPEDSRGSSWSRVIHPDDLSKVSSRWKTALKKGTPYQVECRYLKADDQSYRWHLTRGLPVKDREGKILHWVGTCTDIQILKNTEEELQRTAEELAASNEEISAANEEIAASNDELHETNERLLKVNTDLDNFIYTASHDLKAPIINIDGLIQILRNKMKVDGDKQQDVQKILEMIDISIRRFQGTISDLTEIVRLQRLSELEAEPIGVLDIIREVQLDLKQQIQEAEAAFSIQVEQDASVSFSRRNLKSTLYNLLSNAIKYRSPERKPFIRIYFAEEGRFKVLSVKDNGLGMDVKDKEKVFGMFQRMHPQIEGTGIGLFIVKRIIENAGGKITVESQPGDGAEFRVYFPKE